MSGSRSQQQRGREAVLGAGDGGLTTNADPGNVTVHSTSRFISFRIPRNTLQPMIGDLDASLVRTIPRDTAAAMAPPLPKYAKQRDIAPGIERCRLSTTPFTATVDAAGS